MVEMYWYFLIVLILVVLVLKRVIKPRHKHFLILKEEGFSWALSQYFSGKLSLIEIETQLESDGSSAFDSGAREACRLIHKLNLSKEYEHFDI